MNSLSSNQSYHQTHPTKDTTFAYLLASLIGQNEDIFDNKYEPDIIAIITEHHAKKGEYREHSINQIISLITNYKPQECMIDRREILQNTYHTTFYRKQYCPMAVQGFIETINKQNGIWLIDTIGKLYLQKKSGSSTVLALPINNTDMYGYGHYDDLTHLYTKSHPPIILSTGGALHHIPHEISFQQATYHNTGQIRFNAKENPIGALCDYGLHFLPQEIIEHHIQGPYTISSEYIKQTINFLKDYNL